jgi:hypothetical protein
MRTALFALLVILAACGRPMTETERAINGDIHGDQIDAAKVRIAKGALVGSVTFKRPARPRVTCRERILPPPTSDTVTASPAAVTLFNRVHFTNDWYLGDYVPDYPQEMNLVAAMIFAHEMTHVWQWQQRERTAYTPLRAASEHTQSPDPYLFDLETEPAFVDFGFEQQGAIVEEYVCCRALAPQAPRTRRLHDMLAAAMPVSDLPQSRAHDLVLPWKGADLRGICG